METENPSIDCQAQTNNITASENFEGNKTEVCQIEEEKSIQSETSKQDLMHFIDNETLEQYENSNEKNIESEESVANQVVFKTQPASVCINFSDENLGNFCSQESLNLAKASSPTSTHHLQIPPALVNQADSSINYIQLTEGPALIVCPYCHSHVMTKCQETWGFFNNRSWCCFIFIEHKCPVCNMVIGTYGNQQGPIPTFVNKK